MALLKRVLVFVIICSFCCCRNKSGHSGDKEKVVELKDFISMFRVIKLPVQFADSSLSRKPGDSAIALSVLKQFIPDSLFHKYFGKPVKTKFYASGKVAVKMEETYLFLKSQAPGKRILYVLGFDKDDRFKAAMPLVIGEEDPAVRYTSSMDSKYTITVNRQRKEEGRSLFKKSVYVFNDEGAFTLIMKESNEEKQGPAQIYNPMDTLPHKHKFTGDYIQNNRNFISVRDGRNNSVVRFFVHFEKDKGECVGELKGEARFISPLVARYSSNGDPCSVEFVFSDKNVKMRELEGCGNHRGIRCYFEGVYNKHREAKAKTPKPKQKSKLKR